MGEWEFPPFPISIPFAGPHAEVMVAAEILVRLINSNIWAFEDLDGPVEQLRLVSSTDRAPEAVA